MTMGCQLKPFNRLIPGWGGPGLCNFVSRALSMLQFLLPFLQLNGEATINLSRHGSSAEGGRHNPLTGASCGAVAYSETMTANRLDPAQERAATASGEIQLVLAGPGFGKTTTLVGRFTHLVEQGIDRRR